MTVVGSATVTVSPDATGFGPKTKAAVLKALAGVNAKIDFTIEETGLRTKLASAVKAASTGIEAQIGTNLDAAPIKARVKKAVQDAVADVNPEQLDLFDVDPAQFAADVLAAKEVARAALAAGKQLELDLDFSVEKGMAQLRPAVEAAIAAAGAKVEVEVEVDVDDAGLRPKVTAASKRAEAGQKIKVPVEADSGGADRVGAAAGGIFGRAVLRSAAAVLAAGGLAQLFTAATSGAVAIAGGLVAASAAAGSLVSTVSVLPALLSAAAQAAASIGFAFSGVGGALTAFGAAQKAVGKAAAGGGDGGVSARSAERAVRDATRGIADAEEAMADAVEAATERAAGAVRAFEDAQRSAAETAETATRRMADAEENLADAHRRTQSAQEDLTRARRDALTEIDDLRDSVESLSLAEEDAALRVLELQEKIREGRQGTSAHPVLGEDVTKVNLSDRNRAERDALNLRRAQLSLVEATERRVEAQEKLVKAQADGVEGNEKVIDATERLEAAQRRETDAVEDSARAQRDAARSIVEANQRVVDTQAEVGKSQRDLARAQTDGAERVALAQERLADAVADAAHRAAGGASGVAGAIDAYEAALARLSPASRRFVEFLVGLQPVLQRVQATAAQGLFPGLEQAITTLLPLVDVLEPVLGATALAIAGLAVEGANLMASPGFRGDLVLIGRRNIDIIEGLGRAAISGASSLRHIAVAAGPLTQHVVNLTQHYALLAEQSLALGRANGTLEAFFGRVSTRLDRMLVTIGFLGTGLFRVFREATPAGDRFLDTLTNLAARFDIITERASRSGALRDFFESTRAPLEAVGRLIADLATGLVRIGTANFGAFTVFTDQLRNELLPVLLEVLGNIDTNFVSALISLTTGFANLFGALLNGNPTLALFVNVLGQMSSAVSTLLTDVPVLSPVLQGLVTAFGALAVIGAVQKLRELASSAFGARKALMDMVGATGHATKALDDQAFAATNTGKAYERMAGLVSKAFLIAAVVFAAKQAIDSFAPSVDQATQAVLRSADAGAEFERQYEKVSNPGFWGRLALSAQEFLNNPIDRTFGAMTGSSAKFREELEKFSRNDFFKVIADQGAAGGQRVIDSFKAAGESTEEYERILESVILETAKNDIAQGEVTKKVEAQTRALQGNNDALKEHAERMRKSADAALSLSGATINMEQAFDDLTAAVAKDTTGFDINEQKGRDAKRALDGYVTSIQDAIDKLKVSAAAGQLDADAKQRILDNLEKLAARGFPGAEAAANRLRGELEAIKPSYDTMVNLDTTLATIKLNDLEDRLNYLAKVGVSAENNINRGTAGDPTAREFGGRVLRNQAYLVGERRPELFIPDMNGVILPQVPDMASPKATSMPGFDFAPSTGAFDTDGLADALRGLEDALAEQLAHLQAEDVRPPPGPESGPSEQSVAPTEFDYDALVRALDKAGPRTVTINTKVTSALPGEVATDTARNLRNAIYLEMG